MTPGEPSAEPALAVTALLAHEDVVVRVPPHLCKKPVTVSVPGQAPPRECEPDEQGAVLAWNTGSQPDGRYALRVDLPGGVVQLPFEITHELLRDGRRQFGRPRIIGHRGGKSSAPENTLAAYLSCIEHGADACEMDVRLTRDEQLVIMHDDTVDRTTNGSGRAADLTLAEIKALGTGGEPVPALREVFDALSAEGGFQLHAKLEEDEARTGLLLQKLAEMIAENRYEDRCTILATKPGALRILDHDPGIHIDLEIETGPVSKALARLSPAWFTEGRHRLKSSDFNLPGSAMVRDAHALAIPFVCWASDSSDASVERLLRLGVDAVMTDYPERMGAIIDRLDAIAAR